MLITIVHVDVSASKYLPALQAQVQLHDVIYSFSLVPDLAATYQAVSPLLRRPSLLVGNAYTLTLDNRRTGTVDVLDVKKWLPADGSAPSLRELRPDADTASARHRMTAYIAGGGGAHSFWVVALP